MAGQPTPQGQVKPPNINQLAAQGIQGAGMGTVAGMNYSPLSVSGSNVTANQLGTTDLTPYMNPYDEAVVKANEADILRGANIGMGQLQSQAQAAGAYGGSRHGVAMGDIGRETLSQLAKSSAGLRQAGFQNAQQMAQGAKQQALQQSVLDAAANKYQGYVQHPAQGLAYLNAALGVTPTTPQTTTTTKQPGLFDYLTLGASGYTGGA